MNQILREHVIEHGPQRIDVCGRRQGTTSNLFGAGVGWRERAGHRVFPILAFQYFGQAKVEQFGFAVC